MANDNKKGLNTNSNVYTIVYSAVMVVIVAFLLAFVYQTLKDRQDANVALDKKKQILYALNIRGLDDEAAAQKYNEVVEADRILNAMGGLEETEASDKESTGFRLGSAEYKEGQLALFVCNVDGARKYVIPVYGMGLWGPISGYVALDDDCQTVYGVYFNHESETAGLGAEIKDSQAWQELFQGKRLFDESGQQIALSVEKQVSNPASEVDAVTGATLTSNGVRDMLKDCLGKYVEFFKANSKEDKSL
jgi:Na+-transporting NADH:ubiquinone oxidoreductase subunit C